MNMSKEMFEEDAPREVVLKGIPLRQNLIFEQNLQILVDLAFVHIFTLSYASKDVNKKLVRTLVSDYLC